MTTISLTIDDKRIEVPEGTTVLDAAKGLGVSVPALCHMDLAGIGFHSSNASCRLCVVEVEGRGNLAPACTTKVCENMVVKTHTPRVLNARRVNLELLLSDHPKDCLSCAKAGACELQDLAANMGIRQISFEGEFSTHEKDTSSFSIVREPDKCVMCRRCENICREVQGVGVLTAVNRGFDSVVVTAFDRDITETNCTFCGQCVAVCPTGALSEKDETSKVIRALADPSKKVVVQVAPAIRTALGECFGMKPGTLVTGKLAAALRRLEFDYVFDTDFAADLTIMEEASELLSRITKFLGGDKGVKLPILTSCCPAWVNHLEKQFPDLLEYPSSAKSPMQMFGAIAKSYLAEKIEVKREEMVVVSVMPCVAKKAECAREELAVDGNPDVDITITTRELAALIKRFNIDFHSLPEEDFDAPLGESTGAAVIFGTTGGVIEAAARSAYEFHTGKTLENVEFNTLRGFEGIREATIDFDGTQIRLGIAHGLKNARTLMEQIRRGESAYHAIEVMACPGGCIGGGGQPFHKGDEAIIRARQKAIYTEDAGKTLRKSHENPYIQELYEKYLGKPLGEKAHKLLHTHYIDRSKKKTPKC
ncbi:MAG: [FeFe] hydrogenase, group A [Desulfobacterales bacterium]|nr:[FeFe] hydrogenase, group A [Desulfobacterales bacterium]